MAHPMGIPQQPRHMDPEHLQHQNITQQRQAQHGQQQFQGQPQSKGGHGPPLQLSSFDPQLALFILEKHKNVDTWEEVHPEKQQFSLAEIRKSLVKLRKGVNNPMTALDKIPSTTCRALIHELVDDETAELQETNKYLQWRIASVELTWRSVKTGLMTRSPGKVLRRVKVYLETESLALQTSQQGKSGGQVAGMQHSDTPKPNMNPQQPRPMHPTHQPMPPNMRSEHQMARPPPSGPPPPRPGPPNLDPGMMNARPPPPPGPPHLDPGMMNARPPPPPGPPNLDPGMMNARPPPPPGPPNLDSGMMNFRPPPPHIPHPIPPFHHEDPNMMMKQKARRKGKQDSSSGSSFSSSSYLTDSEESVSESGSSNSDRVRVHNVADGYSYVARGRRQSQKQKSRRDRSQHKSKNHRRSQSRSQSRNRGNFSRKRRDSGMIASPNISRRNSFSSKQDSPHLIPAQPNIHIHIDPAKMADGRVRDKGSPKDKKRSEKISGSRSMSGENSQDGGSGTDSYATSSAYTGVDSVFDKPERRPTISHHLSHQKAHPHAQAGFNNPHPSHIYDDADSRPTPRYQHADDYPYESTARRDPYPKEPSHPRRPDLPHRRNTTGNPFDSVAFPPNPNRTTSSFAAGMHEPTYPYHHHHQTRPTNERADEQQDLAREFANFLHVKRSAAHASQKQYHAEREDLMERDSEARAYAEFLAWRNESRGGAPLKRSITGRRDFGVFNDGGEEDDFEVRYSASRRGVRGVF